MTMGKTAARKEWTGESGAHVVREGNRTKQTLVYNHCFEMVLEAYNMRFPTHRLIPDMVDSSVSNRRELPEEVRPLLSLSTYGGTTASSY